MKHIVLSAVFLITLFLFAEDSLFWDFANGLQGWEIRGGTEITVGKDGLEFNADGKSVLASPELEIEAGKYDTAEFILSSDRNDVFGFCFASSSDSFIPEYRINKALPKTGQLCLFRQSLNAAINWKNTVKGLELYPSAGASHFKIRSVRLFKASENMLFWGDMETLIDGSPAEWTLSPDAVFQETEDGNRITLQDKATAACSFASLDTLSDFNFSVETIGGCGEATVTFLGENDEVLETVDCTWEPSDAWQSREIYCRPKTAWRGEISFRSLTGDALSIRRAKVVRAESEIPDPQPVLGEPSLTISDGPKDFPECCIRLENGVGTIFVNGQRVNSVHNWFWCKRATDMRNAREIAGLKLVALGLNTAGVGLTPNGYDYTQIDEFINTHYLAYPDTFFFLYFDISGGGALQWWCDAHPEALCRPEDGSELMHIYGGERKKCASMSSKLWQSTIEEAIRNLVKHIKASPYADRVIGFHPEAGLSYEWMQYGSQAEEFSDYSDCAVESFRDFLRERYANDQALQAAWHNPNVTLATAGIPPTARRKVPANGVYFDPKSEQDILDHNEFQQQTVSHCITRFCRAIKEESDNRCLTGVFYGYTNYLHDMVFMCQNTGHADARHVLDSPYVDYLIAPVAYNQRRPGAFIQTMIAPWACNANGKIFFNQVDFRNHHAPGGEYYRTDNLQESVTVLYRELARNLAEGNSFQFLDFGCGWTFGDVRLAQVAGRMGELFEKYRWSVKDFDRKDYLLVVVDERLMEKFNCFQPPFERELIYNQVTNLDAAGIPWRCVLLSDLLKHPELQEYGAFLFLNQFRMDDEIADFLQTKIFTGNKLVSFVGPVGILTPTEINTQYAEKLFGRKFRLDTTERDAHCTATTLWPALNGETWGSVRRQTQAYILLPQEADETEIVGRMVGDNAPGALFFQKGDCRIYWSPVAQTTPAMLRELARRGGIPVVADENDAHFIGCGFIGVHAHTAGRKTIRLIGDGTPREILTGETWPKGTREIQLDITFGENRIFIME